MIHYSKDVIQKAIGNLATPEIRVWCHPHKIGEVGSDYYETFKTFNEAEEFISNHKEAEEKPLIAFNGYEIDIYGFIPKSDNNPVVEAAKSLFDSRLGWSEGRNPYAPRKIWADLGSALYGEDDKRVKELR